MILLSAIAMFFNLLIILLKFRRRMYVNATVDTILLGIVIMLTSGSVTGTQEGMIASALLSFYLILSPLPESEPEWFKSKAKKEEELRKKQELLNKIQKLRDERVIKKQKENKMKYEVLVEKTTYVKYVVESGVELEGKKSFDEIRDDVVVLSEQEFDDVHETIVNINRKES